MASDSDAPTAKAGLTFPTATSAQTAPASPTVQSVSTNASMPLSDSKPADAPTATQTAQQKHLLILAGGWENTSSMAYDTSQNTWRKVAPLSCDREGLAATVWHGKMVVAGGYNTSTGEILALVEQYNPETNNWTALPSLLLSRRFLALACFEQALFAIGGSDGTKELDSVERYTMDTQQWQHTASLNTPRDGFCCGVLQVGILAAGGREGSKELNTCELFNSTTQKWQFAGSLVTAREGAAAATLNENMYIFGGREQNYLDSVEEYESDADKWTSLPIRLGLPRWKLVAATVNDRIYICGGWPNGDLVESFDAREMCIYRHAALQVAIEGAAAVSVLVKDDLYSQLLVTE